MERELFDFGVAIRHLKDGHAVARKRWVGNSMYLFITKGNESQIDVFEMGADGKYTLLPNISMKNANDNIVFGWVASTADLLAEDWFIFKI